jgi:hypothetical protein
MSTMRLLVVAALALVVVPVAAAKEVTAVQICGASGCDDADVPAGLHEFPGGSGEGSPPAPAAPFVEVRLTFDRRHVERVWYVPDSRTFANRGAGDMVQWTHAGSQQIDRLVADAASGVEPYRPRAVAAFVGDRRVRGEVSGYLDLFGVRSAGDGEIDTRGFEQISVKTEPPSPWALTTLWFFPEGGLLQRGSEVITLPRETAADIRAARRIGRPGQTSGFDWPLVSGSLLIAAALGLTGALLARRGRPARPERA